MSAEVRSADDILAILESEMKRIKRYGVKRIGLFGSFIRGEAGKESDVDILVEFEKGKKSFDNYMELKFFLEERLGRKVDLVISDALKPGLRKNILGSVRYAS